MSDLSLDRRQFLAAVGALGALSAAGTLGATRLADAAEAPGSAEFPVAPNGMPLEAKVDLATGKVEVNDDVLVRYSACLGCYSSCGNRVKLDRATGKMLTIGGNPYHPSCALPYLDFDEPLTEAYKTLTWAGGAKTHATICGRGQGCQDGYSQPERVTVPLKRAGKRGEGKWKAIGWDQLIKEVTEGGKLFADIGEDRNVEGFKALHDTKTPMNPAEPLLGPVSNQLVMFGSRGDGRTAVGSRFVNSFGSINSYSHGAS
ncbi:hypothetical protein [Adlercreutzia faecimuris]|uniref:Twin-arginine translocation signal domain-containing protein n=1 Tax=Adlercreutzia faecimuris TaxID=2897341 RepID=A0ABS9WEA3_9ACTN|nr:hypothetical protein [Adlercreutzia sp. JBNU-10]MCI2241199.1 hypothetical protein [Adlercreutzia sp. JBNU-10]